MLAGALSFRLRAASSRKETSSCPLTGRACLHAREGMQGVLDGPMTAYRGGQCFRGGHPG